MPFATRLSRRCGVIIRAGAGTEASRSALMQITPEDVGLKGDGDERVVNHFKVAVLSEGSGTQFFSTTFVQWAAREVLRRAQPVTLVARFAPRLTERSMNEALMEARTSAGPRSRGRARRRRHGRLLHLVEPDEIDRSGRSIIPRVARRSDKGAGYFTEDRTRRRVARNL